MLARLNTKKDYGIIGDALDIQLREQVYDVNRVPPKPRTPIHQAIWSYTRGDWVRITLFFTIVGNFVLSFWSARPYKYLELITNLCLIAV